MTPAPLIDPVELADALEREPPLVLDVRWGLNAPPGLDLYRAGHIPGACFVDLDRDLAGPPGTRGRHPLPDAAVFEAAMRRCGVSASRAVVVYDQGAGLSAARAWWLLRYFGHPDVRLLDGGIAAWTALGLALTTETPAPAPGDLVALPGGMAVIDAAEAANLARTGVLLDARAAERYSGETEPIDPVAGHIPGARSAPTAGSVGVDGRLLSREELALAFAAAGVRQGVKVGAYCGSGVTAAHAILALEIAGMRAALYPGSWSEWVADPFRPVAVGAEPG